MDELQEKILERVLATDRRGAFALVEIWAAEHGFRRAMAEVVEPVVIEIGHRWAEQKDICVAQVFSAASLAQDLLTRTAAEKTRRHENPASKGVAVVANIEDDCHSLGRKMVTTFLRADGWEVHDLGVDVLPSIIVDKAMEVGAKVIGVSAMMYTTAMNIRRLREEMNRRGLSGKVMLAAGGAVFVERPELADEVGADGTARNAMDASVLFERLSDRVRQESR